MKAIIVEKPAAKPELRDDIPIPEPGEGQILVKSVYTAVNPV